MYTGSYWLMLLLDWWIRTEIVWGQKQVKRQQVLSQGTHFFLVPRARSPSFSSLLSTLKMSAPQYFLATLVGTSVNVASSFKLWILVLSWEPLSSFNTWISHSAWSCCPFDPTSNDYFNTLSSVYFQLAAPTRTFLEESQPDRYSIGFSWLLEN